MQLQPMMPSKGQTAVRDKSMIQCRAYTHACSCIKSDAVDIGALHVSLQQYSSQIILMQPATARPSKAAPPPFQVETDQQAQGRTV